MGILSNTVSLCQFQVVGEAPAADLIDWAGAQLATKGFVPIEHNAEELSIGWVELDDHRQSDFAHPPAYRRDHFICFTLRKDQRRIPAALLKAHLKQAEDVFINANPGFKRVPKQKKEELREVVRATLLSRTLPVPVTFDAVWDTRRSILSFASLSQKNIELFEEQFKQTFTGLRLIPVHPMARAAQVLPAEFSGVLKKADRATGDGVLEQVRDNQWLGCDFLRWLMYQTLNSDGLYRVSQRGPALQDEGFVAYLNDRLILMGGGGEGVQKVTVAGPQDRFSEVRTALAAEKEITEAVLYLEKEENLWRMNFKGAPFHFASLRSPGVRLEKDAAADQEAEKEAVFFERMSLLGQGLQLFDSLFETFLKERLGDQWKEREAQFAAWLNTEGE